MISWDVTFMKIAELFAEHSTCQRLSVGAVIVKDKRVISCGYNGVPKGMKHCNETFTKEYVCTPEGRIKHHDFSSKYELHAEQNCIAYALKSGAVIDDTCTIYITTEPCMDCAKLIVASGIKNVVFKDIYERSSEGRDFLKSAGINVKQVKTE